MLELHVQDCLTCVEPLSRRWPRGTSCKLLDVGSGGGLPGAVIAIMLDHIDVTCIDAVGKKAAFIQQVASTLNLPNLRAIHIRAEDTRGSFDVITSRAFSTLQHLIDVSKHALSTDGCWLAMKGATPVAELEQLDRTAVTFHVEPVIATSQEKRCLVWIERNRPYKSALASSEIQ